MKPGPKPGTLHPWRLPLNLRCTSQAARGIGNAKRCDGAQGHEGAHFWRDRNGNIRLIWTRQRKTAARHLFDTSEGSGVTDFELMQQRDRLLLFLFCCLLTPPSIYPQTMKVGTVGVSTVTCGANTAVITIPADGSSISCGTTAPSGSASGDLTGAYPGPALVTVGTAGSCGDSTHSCSLTFDSKGRETAQSNVAISGGSGNGVSSTTPVTVSAAVTTDQQLMELSLGAGYLNTLGQGFWFNGAGVYSTAVAQVPTLNFKVKLCTVSGCGSGTVVTLATITSGATLASTVNNNWNLNLLGATAATGATGNLEIHGNLVVDLGSVGTAADTVYADTNTAVSGNISLTGALFVDFTVSTSTGNAGNSITQRLGAVEPQVASALAANATVCANNSTTQSIPNNTVTAATLDTNEFDTNTMHSTSSNTSRITFNTAGVYVLTAYADLDGGGGTLRTWSFRLNGSTIIQGSTLPPATFDRSTISMTRKFVATDFAEFVVFQDSGGSLNIGTDFKTRFCATYQGPGI